MRSDKPADALTHVAAERAIPAEDPYQAAWHKSRYIYAARYALAGTVLDAGSGEGYGAAMLAGVAESVTAVDYSPAAVEHARRSYPRKNLTFDIADLRDLEGVSGPFDLVTCFEVIEHLTEHDALLEALATRTRPGGTLLLSTPNLLYHGPSDANPYHVREVEPSELRRTMRRYFRHVKLLGQIQRNKVPRSVLKLFLDPLYLRRRFGSRSTALANVVNGSGHGVVPAVPRDFVFSRALTRVSPITYVVAAR